MQLNSTDSQESGREIDEERKRENKHECTIFAEYLTANMIKARTQRREGGGGSGENMELNETGKHKELCQTE